MFAWFLRQNMPMEYLFCEEEVYKGDPAVLVPLLQQMRKAWGHHLPATPSRHAGTPRKPPRLAYHSPARAVRMGSRKDGTPARWRG